MNDYRVDNVSVLFIVFNVQTVGDMFPIDELPVIDFAFLLALYDYHILFFEQHGIGVRLVFVGNFLNGHPLHSLYIGIECTPTGNAQSLALARKSIPVLGWIFHLHKEWEIHIEAEASVVILEVFQSIQLRPINDGNLGFYYGESLGTGFVLSGMLSLTSSEKE